MKVIQIKTLNNQKIINQVDLYTKPTYLISINRAIKLSKYSDYTRSIYYPNSLINSLSYLNRGIIKRFLTIKQNQNGKAKKSSN